MSLTPIALTLLIIAAVFFLALNLFRNLFKAMMITGMIVGLIGILLGYVIVEDVKEFSNAINQEQTTYVLETSEINTGFQAKRLNLSTFTAIDKEEIEIIRKEPKGKIFIINQTILDTTTILNEDIQELDPQNMLMSESKELRAQAFAYLLAKTIEEKGPIEMMMYIRDETIQIEPQTPVVILITSTPRQLFKQAKEFIGDQAQKQFDLVREEVNI
jgi:hypothetical protein